jgi:tetratricopeptide (TPR) repeat protein
MALAETLNGGLDPFTSVGKVAQGGDAQARAGIARKELEPMMRAESGVSQDIAKEETRLKRERAQAETLAEEGFAKEKRGAYEQYQAGLEQRPTFNPTEFNAPAAAELAGLTAVIGAIAGAGRARAALKSMEGFTKGHKEGRADLYDREIKQYEKDVQAWKDNVGMAKDKLTQVIDLLSTDKTAALVKAKELDPLLQEGLALAKVRKGDYKGAMDVLNNALKAGDQLDIALSKAAGKSSGLKPGVDLVNKHLMKMRLSGYANQMQEALKDPEFAKKVDQYRALAFAQEQTPIADQLLQKNIPEDIRSFLILAKRFRNEVYRTESGLAVTAYEALRQYGAVPQPGDSARALVTKLQTLERGMKDDLANEQRVVPDLMIAGQRSGLVPVTGATVASVRAPETVKTGEVVDGYKFKGGDPSDQNNWEKVAQ